MKKGRGRPALIHARAAQQLHALIGKLQQRHHLTQEVTAKMIFAAWKGKKGCSFFTLRRWVRAHYSWGPLQQRALLQGPDIQKRKDFKRKVAKMSQQFFMRRLCVLDGHSVAKTNTARASLAAAPGVSSGWRRRSAPGSARLAAPKNQNTSAQPKQFIQPVQTQKIVFAITAQGVQHTYFVPKGSGYNRARVRDFFEGLMPKIQGYTMLLDGEKAVKAFITSKEGRQLCAAWGVVPWWQPPRSPDCNGLDICCNSELDRRMYQYYRKKNIKYLKNSDFCATIRRVLAHASYRAYVTKFFRSYRAKLLQLKPNVVRK